MTKVNLFVFLLVVCMAACSDATDKPNILLIYSDDHGWADLGIQGVDRDIRTPNLDQLARDGVRFTRGYVTAPQCVPSRAGVLTGRYQQRFGVEDNLKGPLPTEELTLAERLKSAGYVTGMSGKWHLDIGGAKGANKSVRMIQESMPHNQGFDEYWRGELRNFYASHDLQGNAYPDAPKVVEDTRFRVVVQTDAALSFLDRRAAQPTQPWFLYLAWYAPHVPLESPEPWFSRTPAHLPLERRQALAMIAAMDDGLGKIREKLRAINQSDNTLIVFIGDNGAPVKPGAWDGSLNKPLIGEKGMLTDGGVRVPFVMAWPKTIPANLTYDQPVMSLDVAATAVAQAGLPADPQLDGVDLVPYLRGQKTGSPHTHLFFRWRSQASILEYPWKLIWLGRDQKFLFDVTQPDGELEENNLIAQHPDIAQRLETQWKQWSAQLKPPGLAEPRNDQDNLFFASHVARQGTMPSRGQPRTPGKASTDNPLQGWLCRGGTLALKDGQLEVKSNAKSGAAPFITINQLHVDGPVTAKITLRSTQAGKATLAWRTAKQADFTNENRASVDLKGDGWETHSVSLASPEAIIHLRFHLPGDAVIQEFIVTDTQNTSHSLFPRS